MITGTALCLLAVKETWPTPTLALNSNSKRFNICWLATSGKLEFENIILQIGGQIVNIITFYVSILGN